MVEARSRGEISESPRVLRVGSRQLALAWQKRGFDLAFAAAVALGYATLGRIGFQGRFDYAVVGTVTNLASGLCTEALTKLGFNSRAQIAAWATRNGLAVEGEA